MIITTNLQKNLIELENNIDIALKSNSLTDSQIEKFLINFEKVRYNILNEIKLYNKNVEFEYEKIKTIDDGYKAELLDGILKINVPEVMPSFKNLKTHSYKRILMNVAEVTKEYEGMFNDKVFIYIKVFDNRMGWDIDNKYVKPIADALITSKVIQDDNITKMFYCAKGCYSQNPHTEILVFDAKKVDEFLENYDTQK